MSTCSLLCEFNIGSSIIGFTRSLYFPGLIDTITKNLGYITIIFGNYTMTYAQLYDLTDYPIAALSLPLLRESVYVSEVITFDTP